MRKAPEKEYKIICTITDRSTGITKNADELTDEERHRAAVIMFMRLLKQQYGPNSVISLTNPRAEELYGIRSI